MSRNAFSVFFWITVCDQFWPDPGHGALEKWAGKNQAHFSLQGTGSFRLSQVFQLTTKSLLADKVLFHNNLQ